MVRRFVSLIAFLALLILPASAQFNKNNLTFGGGLGLQFGDYTQINIAPQVGYNFTSYLNAGAGVGYTYFKDKYTAGRLSSSYLGVNAYARVYPLPYIVAMVQPEVSRMWQTLKPHDGGSKIKRNEVVPVCLVGAGVRLGSVTAMLQYDLVQNDDSPYGSRLFYSIGYMFSF